MRIEPKMTASQERQQIIVELRKITELLGLQINIASTSVNPKGVTFEEVVFEDDPNAVPEKEKTCDHQNVTVSSAPQGSVTRCDDCNEVVGLSKNRKK